MWAYALKSKKRVLKALAYEETDRAPIDYWATRHIDSLLCKHFGVESREEVLRKLEVDLRYVFPEYAGPELRTYADGSYDDVWGVRRKRVETSMGEYDHEISNPLSSISTIEELEVWTPPSPDWYDYDSLKRQCERFRDYATVLVDKRTNRTSVLHAAIYLRGMQQALMDLFIKPDFTRRLYRKITDFYLEVNRRCFEAAGDGIDIFMIGDDLGTQDSLIVSPKIIREFLKPMLAEHARLAEKYGLYVMLHTCGSIRNIIPDLIELGVDILNPIQVRAKNMNPEEIKVEFGDKLCFHGAVDVQWTLPYGTTKDVRAEVRERIQTLGKGGGYILCSTHNIQAGTPLENILAMYKEAKRRA